MVRRDYEMVHSGQPQDMSHVVLFRVDEGQTSLIKAFEASAPRDKGRNAMAKELALHSVGDI